MLLNAMLSKKTEFILVLEPDIRCDAMLVSPENAVNKAEDEIDT